MDSSSICLCIGVQYLDSYVESFAGLTYCTRFVVIPGDAIHVEIYGESTLLSLVFTVRIRECERECERETKSRFFKVNEY